jgi:hypothetical protein
VINHHCIKEQRLLRFGCGSAALCFEGGECGLAVAAAWTAMALAGRWRSQPDAIDRLGRAMGFFWLAMVPVTWVSLMV